MTPMRCVIPSAARDPPPRGFFAVSAALNDPRSPRPDARLLRPRRVFIPLLERLRGLAQGSAVARPLVLRHPRPILRLGRRIAVRMPLHDLPEAPLRLVEALGHERRVRQAELDMRQEVVARQEALDAVPLLPLAVED